MEKHVQTIREFVEFCREIDKSAKGIKTFSRLLSDNMTSDSSKKLIEECKVLFSIIDYDNIQSTDILKYKTGFINLHRIQQLCKDDDLDTFTQYMSLFKQLYSDYTNAVNKLLSELDLPLDCAEALFMKRLFNELGNEFLEIANDPTNLNIESLIPKFALMFKNGKLMDLFSSVKNSDMRMSKVLISVGRLLEKYEAKGE
jgi:hypothetical protein